MPQVDFNDHGDGDGDEVETCIVLRGFELNARIGVHDHEKQRDQRVVISVEAELGAKFRWVDDDIDTTLNYEWIRSEIRELVADRHIALVETLAEQIAAAILADSRVRRVRVSVEKPDVFPDCQAVGVRIARTRPA